MKKIKVSLYFFIMVAISFFLDFHKEFFLAFLTILFHELGHLISIKTSKIEISFIKIEPFGITIRLKNFFIKNPKEEFMVAVSGPLANFILSLICYLLFKDKASFFILSNISMGVFNLLPAYPLDGGRMLMAHLTKTKGYLKSYRLVLTLTKITGIFLVVMGIFIIFISGFNLSFCVIGAFLFFNLSGEEKRTYFYLLKELTEYKEKNRDVEKMPVKQVAVNKNFLIRKILCDLSFLSYHIFTVIEKGKIARTFTEGELMEGLIKYGGKAKICDLM